MDRAERVAALYDIHGNLTALEAVLAEVEALGVARIVVGGDIAWGPEPAACVERLMRLGGRARFVRGNADREVADRDLDLSGQPPEVAAVTRWCAGRLSAGQRAFLGTLPERVSLTVAGLGAVLFCHGSPRSDEEAITAWTSEEAIRPMLAGVREGTVVCGHTHAHFDRTVGETRVVNAGSVGLQYGEGACWALLGPGVELRRTAYDVEEAARRIERSGVPGHEEFMAHVRKPPKGEGRWELGGRGVEQG